MSLTAKQQKLPEGLKKAILAKQAKSAPKAAPKMAKLKTPARRGLMPQAKSAPKAAPKMAKLKTPARRGLMPQSNPKKKY